MEEKPYEGGLRTVYSKSVEECSLSDQADRLIRDLEKEGFSFSTALKQVLHENEIAEETHLC